ncbi:MAG: hypothetical protein ACPIOQ_60005 [Promethearchaeia archaeon]
MRCDDCREASRVTQVLPHIGLSTCQRKHPEAMSVLARAATLLLGGARGVVGNFLLEAFARVHVQRQAHTRKHAHAEPRSPTRVRSPAGY